MSRNQSSINAFFKNLFWKISRRDYVAFNPSLQVSGFGENYSILYKKLADDQKILPVRYNYHIKKFWELSYQIKGTGKGRLRYSVSTPNDEPFCITELNVSLPFDWTVDLTDKEIYGNGEKIPFVNSKQFPLESPWFIGHFEFKTENGNYKRTTGHRIRRDLVDSCEADYYQGQVYSNYDENAAMLSQEILDKIAPFINHKGRLLDIGCATGLIVEHALNNGFDAEGVDFSGWAVEQANKRTGGKCKVLNIDNASASEFRNRYDVITMHSVIEHLKFPERALDLLFDICTPGGVVYVQTLNSDSLMHSFMKEDWGGYTDYTHQSPWISNKWLLETSKKLGFEVLMVRNYHLWNDNVYDSVWQALSMAFEFAPLNTLLEDGFGDAVELILRKP